MKQILQQFTLRASLLVMLLIGTVGSAWGDDYALYSGEITEGDYLIVYNGAAMKAAVSSNRLQYTEVSITNNTISNPTADLVWTISKDNVVANYYKLFNTSVGKYAASTGTKNQATLKETIDDDIRWSVSGNSTYEFVNQLNTKNKINANLRRNGTYGFACYSTSTGGALSLYKKVEGGSITETPTTTTINTTSITNTDVYTSTAAGSLSAIVSAEGNTISGATVTWSSNNTDVATINANGVVTLVAAGTVTFTASYAGVSGQYEASSATYEMTVTNSAPIQAESGWIETDLSALTANDIFVIVGNNGNDYALSNDKGTSSAPTAVAVTIAGEKITSTVNDNIKWNISGNATDGYTFYPNGSTTTWLYCTNTNNGVRVGTNDDKTFKLDHDYLQHAGTSRYVGIYNSQDWRCYTSYTATNIANQTFKFYKRVSANEPTLSASDVELEYNATSGNIDYTLDNTTGGTMSAETTADWLTIGTAGETIPFTCDANSTASERTATVILTYSLTSGGTLTATVTVTQAANPNAVSTIAEVRSQGTGSVQTKGVVTSVNGKTAYIQDATAAIAVYNSAAELTVAVGDEIKVSGTLGTYNGLLQIQSPTINVISNGNTVTPEVMTISQVNASNNQGWLVKIEEAKVTEITDKNVTIAQGENTIVVRFNNTEDITVTENDIITLTGNIGCYNTTKQIANPTDIVKKELITVTLTFNDVPSTIVINETATYAATANPAVTGITYQSSDEDVVMVDANTGEIAALALGTATITASYVGDDDYKSATASYTITVVAALHTAKFFVNGEEQTEAEAQVAEGAAITFPEATPSIEGKTFVGWTIAAIDGETDEAPAVLVTTATMGTADVTYYAVYATQEGEGSTTTVTDELTLGTTGVTGTNYTEWSGKSAPSTAVYAGNSAGGNESIQLRSNNNNSGVVTTTSGGKATKVAVVWNSNTTSGRTLNIYGSNSAYTAATDLYDSSKQGTLLGTVVNGTSTELTITGDYAYIGLRSASGAMYLTSISITWENGTPASYSGYCTTVTTPEQPITVTVGSVGYTTFVAPADVSFPEGVEAFIVTAISTSSIHMEPVTAVPSGTPVVVKASEGTHELSVTTETDDVTDNLLLASDGNVTGNGTIYALGNKSAGVGFYPVKSGAKVPEGKAYLEVNNDNVKEFFSFDFGGLVTEISNVSTDADANAKIYNLAGQRVQKAQKGFYIVGGKKVLVK